MSLAQLWEDPALPPITRQVTISEGGELPPHVIGANWRSNRISTIDHGSRNTPSALPPPAPGTSTDDLMRNLPPERTWRERREAIIAEIRHALALAERALREGERMPGREILHGASLERFLVRIRVSLELWEADLAAGEPAETAPRALEVQRWGE